MQKTSLHWLYARAQLHWLSPVMHLQVTARVLSRPAAALCTRTAGRWWPSGCALSNRIALEAVKSPPWAALQWLLSYLMGKRWPGFGLVLRILPAKGKPGKVVAGLSSAQGAACPLQ